MEAPRGGAIRLPVVLRFVDIAVDAGIRNPEAQQLIRDLTLPVGVGLFAFYGDRRFATPDEIFPTFIVESLPPDWSHLDRMIERAQRQETMSRMRSVGNSAIRLTLTNIRRLRLYQFVRRSARP